MISWFIKNSTLNSNYTVSETFWVHFTDPVMLDVFSTAEKTHEFFEIKNHY